MSNVKGATIGMFDGVHQGHRHLISQLKERCASPIVVTFNNHPLSIINPVLEPALLSTPAEKERLLREAGVTPVLIDFDESLRRLTAAQFINRLTIDYGIDILMPGFNNSIGSDRCSSEADLQRLARTSGVAILRAEELPGALKVNSSMIRALIAEGDLAQANAMLGRHYSLHGTVVHGKALGRRLGFPTANIRVDDSRKLIPAPGVYAADAVTPDGLTYRAVVNIGHRPTVDTADSPTTIEAHLDGFNGDLYGHALTLYFITRLRPECKFPDIDTLKSAIAADLHKAKNLPL